QDILQFTNANGITGTWNGSTGVLTLSGSATKAAYETALESVTFLSQSENPLVYGDRTLSWLITEGSGGSSSATSFVTVNARPSLAGAGEALSFKEGIATIIDSSLILSDADDTNIESATVTISNGYVSSEDVLAFTNANGITGSWNSSSGTLTLSGSATRAIYESALESVSYNNTNSTDPNIGLRTVSWIVNDGDVNALAVTSTINVSGVNALPVLDTGSGSNSISYEPQSGSRVIDSSLNLSDVDNANIEGATVFVSTGYQFGEDVLAFTDANGISGSWDASAGVLILSGSASKAVYEAALESVTYINTSSTPGLFLPRTVSWQVNDGTSLSIPATSIIRVNYAPILSDVATSISFSEGSAAQVLDSTITVIDTRGENMESATITISNGYVSGEDVLAFTNANGITGVWDSGSGTLTLSGNATTAAYETALESVTYQNINNADPSTAARTVSWIINDGAADSSAEASTLTVTAINDAPVLSGAGSTTAYVEGDSPTVIDSSLSLSDVDSANIVGATVAITGGFVSGQDQLAFANANGITGVWNSSAGVLTLSGPASRADYEAALESVTYSNVGSPASLGNRTVTWQVNDGESVSTAVASTISVAPQGASGFGAPSLSQLSSAGMDQSPSGQSPVQDPGFDAVQGVLTETDALLHLRDSMGLDDVGAQNSAAPGLGTVMGELLSTDYIDFSES
ncbi:MAG: hypothetical protein P8N43_06890, partial [Alphaproteobacteria bacterium]|nr:hypothetical protein [Alphaproteobacteria bacterium]